MSINLIANIKKSFSGAQYVPSPWMNYAGMQAARAVLASGFTLARKLKYKPPAALKSSAQLLNRDGVLVIENFLSDKHFTKVAKEYDAAVKNAPDDNWINFQELSGYDIGLSRVIDSLPAIKQFVTGTKLQNIFTTAEKRKVTITSGCLEHYAFNSNECDKPDANMRVHSDIFFATYKAWLLIDDINEHHGPLYYAIGSHRMSLNRLLFEYHSGILSAKNKGCNFFYNANIAHKLRALTLTPITAPKNSLIIANTHGFHKRGQPAPGYIRKAIRISQRYHPFTFGSQWWQ